MPFHGTDLSLFAAFGAFTLSQYWFSRPTSSTSAVEFPTAQDTTPVASIDEEEEASETKPWTSYGEKLEDLPLSDILSFPDNEIIVSGTSDGETAVPVQEKNGLFGFNFASWETMASYTEDAFFTILSALVALSYDMLTGAPLLILFTLLEYLLETMGLSFFGCLTLLVYFTCKAFRNKIRQVIISFFKDELLAALKEELGGEEVDVDGMREKILASLRGEFVSRAEHDRLEERVDSAAAAAAAAVDVGGGDDEEDSHIRDDIAQLQTSVTKLTDEVAELHEEISSHDTTALLSSRQDDLSSSLSSSIASCQHSISGLLKNFASMIETVDSLKADISDMKTSTAVQNCLERLSSEMEQVRNEAAAAAIACPHYNSVRESAKKIAEFEKKIIPEVLKITKNCLDKVNGLKTSGSASSSRPSSRPASPSPSQQQIQAQIPSTPASASSSSDQQQQQQQQQQQPCPHTTSITTLLSDRAALLTILRTYATRNINFKSAFEAQLHGIPEDDLPGTVRALLQYVQSEFGHIATSGGRPGGPMGPAMGQGMGPGMGMSPMGRGYSHNQGGPQSPMLRLRDGGTGRGGPPPPGSPHGGPSGGGSPGYMGR